MSKKRRKTTVQLQEKIEQLLKNQGKKTFTVKQLLDALGLRHEEKRILLEELKNMQEKGRLVKTANGRYGLPESLDMLTGVLEGNRRGFAFLRPDRGSEDVYINAGNLKDAAHGDRVLVRLDGKRKKGRRRREGQVVDVLERGRNRLVGTLRREKKKSFVVPDDRRFPGVVQVPRRELNEARSGDKVVVEVSKWADGGGSARGSLVEHFGPAGSMQTEQLAFKHKYDLPGEFPRKVLNELDILPAEEEIPRLAEEQDRTDLRHLDMVTIDDEQARDFDDAVSLETTAEGGYRLGVHIADVSEYVREGKPIDREALKRGTTTYLVEKAIHMLPPLLSEKLCSLQAETDRLAVSVIMDIDAKGEPVKAQFFSSLIRVNERLTYRQVESYLNGEEQRPFKDNKLPEMLDKMSELAEILRRRRMERGALDLDLPEAQIEIDEEGVPLSVDKREMGRSESLIEEFMIYCNESVARHLAGKKLPCVFRVHPLPAEEKLTALRETLTLLGVKALSGIRVLKPGHLKGLLEETKGERVERLVRYLVLRSLPQAYYSAFNEGHFGLASDCYCHFTSPIRRYPDLVVHRILKQQLSPEGLPRDKAENLLERLPDIARQSSERERVAIEAERASIESKKAQYMEQKLGEIYTGIINGVANFGVFVELDNTVEGMIPINELEDDYYIYDKKTASLVGERTRKTYRLGDEIEVRVIRAGREEGQVTFAPVTA